MNQDTLSPVEVAELFKVNTQTIYQWSRQGKIPFIRIGRRLLFPKKAIDEFFDRSLRLETNSGK